MFEAKNRQIKEELEMKETTADMKKDGSKKAEKTKFSNYMNYIADPRLELLAH
ncbi:MAG: hypothetical protein OEY17_04275 [Nitrosopumilus sp.]|nr:hypothetical protein [Nitrosopumilus sp.]MDH5658540.1 hypothetical protein [Nitrosopumilus sp.]